ncbi:YIP1 family protein [Sphingomonas sp. JC676]|uniref:Yip1 family protein n=1 Tax=Sphingomonas sp. JC676 TaxID=2768065 RepID=UPI0016580960|nr:Yip1 family protein [Sphingomonas sp. JC676]MBC9033460.1 YIP1 family protein [Sphingomonas sp. JC676]
MASEFPETPPAGTGPRIKRILLEPKAEWARIDAEPATVSGIMTGWVVPLAAIGPVAGLIGSLLFGYGIPGIVSVRPSLMFALTTAIVAYVCALISIFVLALIIDALAPSFGGTQNRVQAMKVAAYSATASYVAAIFQIIPPLAILGILGLYTLYLLYLGLPRLMKAPAEKAAGYTVVTILCAVVLYLVVGWIVFSSTAMFASRAMFPATAGGSVTVPGVGTIDTAKIDEAAQRMQAVTDRMQKQQAAVADGKAPALPPEQLAAMLPASIGGWNRTATESSSGAAAGIGGSNAQATYTSGDKQFRLSITDAALAGAMGAMGEAMGVQSNREDADGYEKVGVVGGRMTTEKWQKSGSGTYGVLYGSRFMVEAEGEAPDMATLKSAVGAVDAAKLESLAK